MIVMSSSARANAPNTAIRLNTYQAAAFCHVGRILMVAMVLIPLFVGKEPGAQVPGSLAEFLKDYVAFLTGVIRVFRTC